jgi:hypothetical protein
MFNGLTVLSLVLCAATVTLWVRSYRWEHLVPVEGSSQSCAIMTSRGKVVAFYYPNRKVVDRPITRPAMDRGIGNPLDHSIACLGFVYVADHQLWWRGRSVGHLGRILAVPDWFLYLVFLILPAVWFRWGRGRLREGFCVKCGYNLTGNVSGVCPECGTVISK